VTKLYLSKRYHPLQQNRFPAPHPGGLDLPFQREGDFLPPQPRVGEEAGHLGKQQDHPSVVEGNMDSARKVWEEEDIEGNEENDKNTLLNLVRKGRREEI
jgi:hypothetical protein